MSHQMIIWCVIAGVLLCAFLLRAVERYFSEANHKKLKLGHVLQLAKDKDIFFLPGDADDDDIDDF